MINVLRASCNLSVILIRIDVRLSKNKTKNKFVVLVNDYCMKM